MPQLPDKFLRFVEEQNRAAPSVLMGSLFEMLDRLNGEQMVSVLLWVAEHPLPGTDPVQLALKHVNALTETDFLDFFTELKNQTDEDLWGMLTDA